MKRVIGLMVVVGLGFFMNADEGFFTRNVINTEVGMRQKTGYIECWRANNQSPNPVKYAIFVL